MNVKIVKKELGSVIECIGILELGIIVGEIVQVVKFNEDLVLVEYHKDKEVIKTKSMVFVDEEQVKNYFGIYSEGLEKNER